MIANMDMVVDIMPNVTAIMSLVDTGVMEYQSRTEEGLESLTSHIFDGGYFRESKQVEFRL
jgi:hypothetical protein